MNQIERVKIKLRLAKNTDSFFETFGASSHKFVLNKPLGVDEVRKFEKEYNISLPEEYQLFLTKIGNGGIDYKKSSVGNSGAGPSYGIFKLGHPNQFISESSLQYLEKKPFFNEEVTKEQWEKAFGEIDDIPDEGCDKEMVKAYSGVLNIGFCGCSGFHGIILNGKNKGRIIRTYDEIEYCPDFLEETNFLDWYESWLDRIISGKEFMREHRGILKNEKDIIARFVSDINDTYWQFRRLDDLRNLETLTSDSIKVLWEQYKFSKEKQQKVCTLNFLTKFDYITAKEEISRYLIANPLEFLRNIHLYAKDKTNEWTSEIDYIKKENYEDVEVIEYIKYVTEPDAKTIAN